MRVAGVRWEVGDAKKEFSVISESDAVISRSAISRCTYELYGSLCSRAYMAQLVAEELSERAALEIAAGGGGDILESFTSVVISGAGSANRGAGRNEAVRVRDGEAMPTGITRAGRARGVRHGK